MLKIAIPTLLLDVAAVLSGRRGAVRDRAQQAGCRRQTVYDHAQAVEDRLAERDRPLAHVRAASATVRADRDQLRAAAADQTGVTTEGVRRFAIARQAIGVSLRQVEELLGTLLPADRVPDHATLGRWTAAAGQRAGEVLAELDPLGRAGVDTVCVDEIFFGGSRRGR